MKDSSNEKRCCFCRVLGGCFHFPGLISQVVFILLAVSGVLLCSDLDVQVLWTGDLVASAKSVQGVFPAPQCSLPSAPFSLKGRRLSNLSPLLEKRPLLLDGQVLSCWPFFSYF